MTRYLQIAFLAVLTISGAAFMTLESAGYYSMIYAPSQLFIAWGAAILSEMFQHILIMVPGSTNTQNRIFKSVALVIFCLTVIAAGYKIYRPVIQSLNDIQRADRLASVLEREIDDNREDRATFHNQRLNAAKSVNSRRQSSEELKKLIKNGDSKPLTLFEIIHLFLLRISIQIATLACAWKIGKLARRATETVSRSPKRVVKKWRAKHLRQTDKFVGVVQFDDGSFVSITPHRKRAYKTFNGAVLFFKDTKHAGRIPAEPTFIYEGM